MVMNPKIKFLLQKIGLVKKDAEYWKKIHTDLRDKIARDTSWLTTISYHGSERSALPFHEQAVKYHEYKNMVIQRRAQYVIIFLTIALLAITAIQIYLQFFANNEPHLIVTSYKTSFDNVTIQITNTNDNPALMIRTLYRLNNSENWQQLEDIPYLSKDRVLGNLELSKFNEFIKRSEEAKIKALLNKTNESIEESDYFDISEKFDIVLSISCNGCSSENIEIRNNISYFPKIRCEKDIITKEIGCDISSSEIYS